MPDGGEHCTERTLHELVEVVSSSARLVPARLSALIATFVPHDALVFLAADAAGGVHSGAGDADFVSGVSLITLDELRREGTPGKARDATIDVRGVAVPVWAMTARNGALLVLGNPREPRSATARATALQLWCIVALRLQEPADAAQPSYLQRARASSGVQMDALTELADDYSTTLESALAALRSPALDDAAARLTATNIAASGLVHLRTASDRVRTVTEESVTTAFAQLRDDLRPVIRYRQIEVQFVDPPVDARALPSEVAHGARAMVRGTVLALVEQPAVSRVRVQWDCDGSNLLIDMRDDGGGVSVDDATLRLVRQRVHALDGSVQVQATPGWGTDMSIVIPLDPPGSRTAVAQRWDLRPREVEVLELLAAGSRNRDIADRLAISENTVKFHLSRIYRKLDVKSRAQAAVTFFETHATP